MYIPRLINLYYNLNLEDQNYDACINIMKYISGKEIYDQSLNQVEDMDVDQKSEDRLNLTPYINQKCLSSVNKGLSDLIVNFIV